MIYMSLFTFKISLKAYLFNIQKYPAQLLTCRGFVEFIINFTEFLLNICMTIVKYYYLLYLQLHYCLQLLFYLYLHYYLQLLCTIYIFYCLWVDHCSPLLKRKLIWDPENFNGYVTPVGQIRFRESCFYWWVELIIKHRASLQKPLCSC